MRITSKLKKEKPIDKARRDEISTFEKKYKMEFNRQMSTNWNSIDKLVQIGIQSIILWDRKKNRKRRLTTV
jgi:hypothetical protein